MRRFALALVLLASLAVPAAAQGKASGLGQGDFTRVEVKDPDFEGMFYTVFVPQGLGPGRLYPLVLALHGNGHKSEAHVRNLARLSSAEQPVFVVAPQYQKGTDFNNPTYEGCGKKFREIVATVCAEQPIDRSRLFVEGFSMGANFSCGIAYGWEEGRDGPFPYRAVFLNGTAVPPTKAAPKVPYVCTVGEKETAVMGQVNVVRMVRETYREMASAGYDVRYHEIPGMGHTVDERCLEIMRAAIAEWPDFSGIPVAGKKTDPVLLSGLTAAATGRFLEAIDQLGAWGVDDGTAPAATRTEAKKAKRKLEEWLEKLAPAEAKRLEAGFAGAAHDWLLAVAFELEAKGDVGKAFTAAVAKLDKSKVVKAEREARAKFQEAVAKLRTEAEAAKAALTALANGPLRIAEFGRRAAQALQALADAPGPGGQ